MKHSDKDNNSFSPTEVGTLIESFRSEMKLMAEKLNSVADDVHILKQDSAEFKSGLTQVKDAIRLALPSMNTRLRTLESKAGLPIRLD